MSTYIKTTTKMARIGFNIEGMDGDDRLVIPSGDLDIVIMYATDGTGLVIDVYPLDVVDEPYETACIAFDDSNGSLPDFKFDGFNESMIKHYDKCLEEPEQIVLAINGVRISIQNYSHGVAVVGYNTAVDILFDLSVSYGIDPHAPRNN